MDSVKFGRVLGIGARLAGRTIVQAVDAAASPNPRATTTPPPPQQTPTILRPTVIRPAAARPTVARATASARATTEGVARGSKKFGQAFWTPMVRTGKVLWLEVTGVFFGIVALFAVQGVWVHRAGALAGATTGQRKDFWLAFAMAVAFGYFCVSSFLRANRKDRA